MALMQYANTNIGKKNITEVVSSAIYKPLNNLLRSGKEDKMERDIRNWLLNHITEVGIDFNLKE
jgi:hypothetical protein